MPEIPRLARSAAKRSNLGQTTKLHTTTSPPTNLGTESLAMAEVSCIHFQLHRSLSCRCSSYQVQRSSLSLSLLMTSGPPWVHAYATTSSMLLQHSVIHYSRVHVVPGRANKGQQAAEASWQGDLTMQEILIKSPLTTMLFRPA